MRRVARVLGPVLGVLLAAWLFLFPAPAAQATGGGGVCSICTPTGVELEAELAGGTPELTAFAQMTDGLNVSTGAGFTGSGATPYALSGVQAVSSGAASTGFAFTSAWAGVLGFLGLGVGATLAGAITYSGTDAALPAGSAPRNGASFMGSCALTTCPAYMALVVSADGHTATVTPSGAGAAIVTKLSFSISCQSTWSGADSVASARSTSYTNSWPTPVTAYNNQTSFPVSVTCGTSFISGGYGSAYDAAGHFAQESFVAPASTYQPAPSRYVEQTVTCSDGSSSTITGTPAELHSGGTIGILALSCPSGTRLTGGSDVLKTSGGSDLTLATLTPPDTSGIPSACLAAGNSCTLRLQYQTSTGVWATCETGVDSVCTGFMTSAAATDVYRCQYGTGSTWYTVALRACSQFASQWSSTPSTGADPYSTSDPGPTTDGTCGIGWGDVLSGAIVYKAVGCAMQWAFVPSEATLQTSTTTLTDAWDGSVLGQTATALGNFVGPLVTSPSGSAPDCHGPSVSIAWVNSAWTAPVYPLDVCAGVPKKIHDWALPFILVLMWATALVSAWFFVGQAFDVDA